MAKVVLRD